jgi:hypothetical protein
MPSRVELVALYQDFDPAEPVSQDTLDQFVARSGESAKTICEDLQLGLDPLGKWVISRSPGRARSPPLRHRQPGKLENVTARPRSGVRRAR